MAGGEGFWRTVAVVGDALTYHGATLTKSATQALSTTAVAITWDGENEDSDGFHDNATNPARFTVPDGQAGRYRFDVVLRFESLGFEVASSLQFRKNGSTLEPPRGQQYGAFGHTPLSVELNLVAGDYVEVMAAVSSGTGAAGTTANGSLFQGRRVT